MFPSVCWQVLVTSSVGWYDDCGCTGLAFLGVFDEVGDSNKPALVFYDTLLTPSLSKGIAEAISHEVGALALFCFQRTSPESPPIFVG